MKKKWKGKWTKLGSFSKMGIYAAISMVLAFIVGTCIVFQREGIIALAENLMQNMKGAGNWIMGVTFVLEAAFCLYGYRRTEELIVLEHKNEEEDVEDDTVNYRIEFWGTWTNVAAMLGFVLIFLIYILTAPQFFGNAKEFVLATILMIGGCAFSTVYQVFYVRQVKRRDPSKKGDPADFNFSKKWMESCDEAEKEMVYQASFQTLNLLRGLMLVLILLASWGYLLFDTGVMAVVLIAAVWIIITCAYYYYCLKLQKTKLNG